MKPTVFERSSGQEFRFVPEGAEISAGEWGSCLLILETVDFDYVITL